MTQKLIYLFGTLLYLSQILVTLNFFHRQAILSGNRVPFLWGGAISELSNLHRSTGADIGIPDWSMEGVPVTRDESQAKELPWAVRYLNCESDIVEICNSNKFNAACWVDRDDIIPPTEQKEHPCGQENESNLGFRAHRFKGRKLTYMVLTALGRTLDLWMDKSMTEGYPISDHLWHVTDRYNTIREKTGNMQESFCENRMKFLPRLCNVPMKGRSEYTPRFKPDETSIRSIIAPYPNGEYHSFSSSDMLYDVFDLPILSQKVPDEALNVIEIAGKRLLRRRRLESKSRPTSNATRSEEKKTIDAKNYKMEQNIWSFINQLSGYCDGKSSSHCNRNKESSCLLDGHHDSSSVLKVTSGLIKFQIPEITEGIVLATLAIKTTSTGARKLTKNKKQNNSNERTKNLRSIKSSDEYDTPPFLPRGVLLDISVNGNIQTYKNHELDEILMEANNEFATIILLNDETGETNTSKNVVGLQLRCESCKESMDSHLEISHILWS